MGVTITIMIGKSRHPRHLNHARLGVFGHFWEGRCNSRKICADVQLGYFFQLVLKRLRRLNYCVKRRPIAIVFFGEFRANNAL